jgi:DNA-binding beta-propeller fold protein YncE
MKTTWIVLAAVALLAARANKPSKVARAEVPDEGTVAVYLKPLEAGARGFAISLEGVSATREDGSSVRLTLALDAITRETAGRQRLLAWGAIPPGSYTGLAFRIKSASRKGAEGTETLTPADGPAVVPFPFSVNAKRAALAAVEFDAGASHLDESGYHAVFSPSVPGKLAVGLQGIVSCPSANVLAVFDKVSGQVAALIPTGRGPSSLAIDASRNRLYVALSRDDAVATVDLLAGDVIGVMALRAGDEPGSIALLEGGGTLAVANTGSSTVALLDASGPTLIERRRVNVGSGPRYLLADKATGRVWVFNSLDDTVSLLTLPDGLVAATVGSSGGPIRGQLNRAGSRLYVIHQTSPYLDVVDTAALTIVQRVYVGPGASAIKVDSQSDRVYLGFRDTGAIEVFEPTTFLPTDRFAGGSGTGYLTIEGDGNNLCVVLPQGGEVRLLRLVGKSTVARTDVPEPREAALVGER